MSKDSAIRFAAMDIETTGLDASYGRMLCGCFKFFDEDNVRTVTCGSYSEEPKALAQLAEWWDEADVVVHWNGKLFDVAFINARMMIRRKQLPKRCRPILDPQKKQIDGRWIKNKLRTRTNRLENAAIDLNLRHRKYDVPAEHWNRAAAGDTRSLAEIVQHCQRDVLITEEIMGILKHYIVRVTR